MSNTLTGTIKAVLGIQTGEGKNGQWHKQEVILTTDDEKYPKDVCLQVWNEQIDAFNLREGERVTVHFDVQSREYNDRWYTDVKAWRVDREEKPKGPDSDMPF